MIVCGLRAWACGPSSSSTRPGSPVVVVDDEPDPRLVRVVEGWDVPYIVGSPRLGGVLEQAGLSAARAVVCAERTEVQTLETALLISELRPDIRVVVQLANAAVGCGRVPGHRAGHRARRGRPGRPLHRRGLPGQRLVPDRAGRHPLHDRRGRGRAVRLPPGPLRGPGPGGRGPGRRCPHRGLPGPGPHGLTSGDRVTVLGTPDELAGPPSWASRGPTTGRGARARRTRGRTGLVRRVVAVVGSDANSTLRVGRGRRPGPDRGVGRHPPARATGRPGAGTWTAHRPLLHRRDHLHGRVRRLLLRRPVDR